MSGISAKATFSKDAKLLFESPDSSRAVLKEVIRVKTSGSQESFKISGMQVRTTKTRKKK